MSGALKQVEGAVTDGLSAALDLEMTMRNGQVRQRNFHQYNIVRMCNTPLN
jgi:isoquinoline 1-oxidoreductase beta subunit